MSTPLSNIFKSLQAQQLPALITLLKKGQQFAADQGLTDTELLERRLIEDMHPLRWQIQTVLELSWRALARLSGQEPPALELTEPDFEGVIERAQKVLESISEFDLAAVDASSQNIFEIPVGPESSLKLTGEDYVLKFYLPNLYFHLTTTYNLMRAAGVPIGKLDYMGPITV